MIGLSSGHIAVYDCAQAKMLRQTSICTTSITAVAFHPESQHQIYVASQTQLQLVKISPTLKHVEQIEVYCRSSKKASKRAAKGESGLSASRLAVNQSSILQVDKNGQIRVSSSSQTTPSAATTTAAASWTQANVH